MMKFSLRTVTLALVLALLLLFVSACGYSETVSVESTAQVDASSDTTVRKQEKEAEIIHDIVRATVEFFLVSQGFSTMDARAGYGDDTASFLDGIAYINNSEYRETDNHECGFVRVACAGESFLPPSSPSRETLTVVADGAATTLRAVFAPNEVMDFHFSYGDAYVQVEWTDTQNICYSVFSNNAAFYDKDLGSVYNILTGEVDYEDDLTYAALGAVGMENRDYTAIQNVVHEVLDSQDATGMTVEGIFVLCLDAVAIESWMTSGTSFEEFFGVSTSMLASMFSSGAYTFTSDGGVSEGAVIEDPFAAIEQSYTGPMDDYDWDLFFAKILGGCTVIFIGALLAPMTSGCSVFAAMSFMVKTTITATMLETATATLMTAAISRLNGESEEMIADQTCQTMLDTLSTGFLFNSLMVATTVNLGLTPVCFPAGSLVRTETGDRAIETLSVGELVLATNQETGENGYYPIEAIYQAETDRLVRLQVSDTYGHISTIEATPLHPFYLPIYNAWASAEELSIGDILYGIDGEPLEVVDTENVLLDSIINVYNLSVAEAHTYYVCGALVHNSCSTTPNKSNYRKNAMIEQGLKEADVIGQQAHHMLPQNKKYTSFFNRLKINIHESRYISFIETDIHLKGSRAYDQLWRTFIESKPKASYQSVIDHMKKFMFDVFGHNKPFPA